MRAKRTGQGALRRLHRPQGSGDPPAMLSYGFPFDSLPAAAERLRRDVPQLRAARAAGAAPAAASRDRHEEPRRRRQAVKKKAVAVEDALRYAMSLPVATTVSGIDSMRCCGRTSRIAQGFKPMTRAEMARLRRQVAEFAGDGRFELTRSRRSTTDPKGDPHTDFRRPASCRPEAGSSAVSRECAKRGCRAAVSRWRHVQ